MSYFAREYEKEDWPTVKAWWDAHTTERMISENLLPPVGVVVLHDGQPVAACWAHLSVNIGVAFLESPVTKPGLKLKQTFAAMEAALGGIEAICKTHDYHVLIAYTLPAIGRQLERRHGFIYAGDRVQLMKILD